MKKLFLFPFCILLLVACSEKNAYETALLENVNKEQDIKDYQIPPEDMVKCIFNTTSANMPGFATYDPYRRAAYDKYAKMLSIDKAPDPKKALAEVTDLFGSPKKMAEAHTNYTESVMECYSVITDTRPDKEPETKKEPQKEPPVETTPEAQK